MSVLTPLGDLIQTRLEAEGWSVRRLAVESKIGKTQIANYMHGPLIDLPSTKYLRNLARALRMPEWIIVDAALATVGLDRPRGWSRTPDIDEAVDAVTWLDDGDRKAIKAYFAVKRNEVVHNVDVY